MRRILPGLVTTALLAACAFVLATLPMAPFTLENGVHPLGPSSVAILLGILFANILSVRSSWVVGLRFSSRVILPIGIVLLGARLAFGFGARVVLVAETLGASSGIGYRLRQAADLVQTDQVFAWTLTLVALMLVLEYGLLKPMETWLFSWRKAVKN